MIARIVRLTGLGVIVGFTVWITRLVAHAKVPPPEGRWREVTEDELKT